MRFNDEEDESGLSTPVIYAILVVSALVLIILGVVLVSNSKKGPNRTGYTARVTPTPDVVEETEISEFADQDIEKLYKEHKLRSEDLDFWDMYDRSNSVVVEEDTQEEEPEESAKPSPTASAEPTEEELAADGKHIQVSYKDGTSKWIEIDEELPKNDYDYTKLKTVNGKMTYYEGNKKLSRLGVILSEDNGTIDFQALKEDGLDFVILKVGGRGYSTGLITPDKNFEKSITDAEEAGLDVGVLFSSQAVTVQEATEEAKFVSDQLLMHKITYPVAYCMESILMDRARTDILDETQKTEIVEAFMRDMESDGYNVILYADESFLLTEILTSELLKDKEVWLKDDQAIPEYPYSYKMWEYGGSMRIPSSATEADYVISFVDYSKR